MVTGVSGYTALWTVLGPSKWLPVRARRREKSEWQSSCPPSHPGTSHAWLGRCGQILLLWRALSAHHKRHPASYQSHKHMAQLVRFWATSRGADLLCGSASVLAGGHSVIGQAWRREHHQCNKFLWCGMDTQDECITSLGITEAFRHLQLDIRA